MIVTTIIYVSFACYQNIDSFEILLTNTIKSTLQKIATINNTSGNINSNNNNNEEKLDNEGDVKTPAGVVQITSNTSFDFKDTNANSNQFVSVGAASSASRNDNAAGIRNLSVANGIIVNTRTVPEFFFISLL